MKKRIIFMLVFCCILFCSNLVGINASNNKMRVYHKEDMMNVQDNDMVPYVSLESVQPRMIITQTAGIELNIEGNQAGCTATVVGVSSEVKRVKVIMHLQKQDNKGNFYDIAKWEIEREGTGLSAERYYPLSSRGIYRAQADAYVYDFDNNCELNFFYSYEEYY